MDAKEAERLLFLHDFALLRTKASQRIYQQEKTRVVIPFHGGKSLHPNILKEVPEAVGRL